LGHSKRYNSNFEKINRDKEYSLEEAAELLSSFSHPKFDESVELAINLGVDPKHADQIVRGTVALPNGIGKDIKVLVFARDGLAEEAKKSGVQIYQKSKVTKIEKKLEKFNVIANDHIITSNKIVMATNGFYKDDLLADLNNTILPVISNIIITRPLTNEEVKSHNFVTYNPILNFRNLLFYYRLLKDNRFLFGARGDLIGSEQSSKIKSKKMEEQMKKVFPNWKNVEIDFHWRGLVAVTTKFTPSIGKLDDEIYYSFGYQANGVNTAPWSGNELAKLIVSNSKKLNISKFYQGLPKKFPFPFLRLLYLRITLLYYSFIDK